MQFKTIKKLGYIVYALIVVLMLYVVLVADFFAKSYYTRIISFSIIIFISIYIANKIINYEIGFYLVVKRNISPKLLKILFRFDYIDNQDIPILNTLRERAGNPPIKNLEED